MGIEKVIDFGEFSIKIVQRFKDAEIEIFEKGRKTIDSCVDLEQIETAKKYVDLISAQVQFREVGKALQYFCESKTREIVWHDALNKTLADNEARDAIAYDIASKEIDAQTEVDFQTDVDFEEVSKMEFTAKPTDMTE